MNKKRFILLCATVLLAGCSLSARYTPPEAPIPGEWPSGTAYKDIQTDTGLPAAAELKWRDFFIDKRLQTVIETALNNNRDLRLATLQVQRAKEMYGIQRASLFPALDATANGSKQRVPADLSSSGKAQTVEQYDVNLGIISWEMDFFGRIRSMEQQALEQYLATEQGRRSAQILLISSVANAYFTLAADRQAHRLARSTLETQRAAYALISRRYEVGIATELDLRQAQMQVETARGDVARYTLQVAKDENALALIVGSPAVKVLLPADLSSAGSPGEISPGTSSGVLLNRPDILAAEHQLRAASANISVARAAFFPRISLTTSAGTASSELSGLFLSGSDTWIFAPNIVMPIFDARTWSAFRASKVEREIALARYEKAIQNAFSEVADTLAVRGTIGERLSAQQSLVTAAAETHRLYHARYTRGIDSYLGVLDAQRSLYAAQQGLISLRLAERTNQVRLYAVLGGGGD